MLDSLLKQQAQAHAAWAACPKTAKVKKQALADTLLTVNKAVRDAKAAGAPAVAPPVVPKWVQRMSAAPVVVNWWEHDDDDHDRDG